MLYLENDYGLMPGLPRLADQRLRDGCRRQGSANSHAGAPAVGARGQTAERTSEFGEVWRKYASQVVDTDAMSCGHFIAEEMPDHVYERFIEFFKA